VATEIPEITLGQLYRELQVEARRIPIEGTVETTFRCNLNCVHCYVNQPAGDREVAARELTTERLLALIDEIADAGCLSLLLTGGEVLVRADFPQVYLHALRRGLRVTLFTNGTLITERIADLLDEHRPARVEITLYGMTEATYQAVTRVPGSYRKCLDGIRRLVTRGVPLKLKAMALTLNEHEIADIRAFAASLGLPFQHDTHLNGRVDCGANRNPELQLPPERAVALDLADPETVRKLRTTVDRLPSPDQVQESRKLYTCGAGQISFTVDPYGSLQLCQLSRRSGFDLRQGPFERGWREHLPRLRAREWQTRSVCRTCSLIALCGSCAGAAELEHGDPEAVVAQFCEIAHLRATALRGDLPGHRRDATCCLGRGEWAARAENDRVGLGCTSCGHAEATAPATGPLVQIQRPAARRP
jgi:radical SAM protein with 4Fe4S-binding SPASM domain